MDHKKRKARRATNGNREIEEIEAKGNRKIESQRIEESNFGRNWELKPSSGIVAHPAASGLKWWSRGDSNS
jgi:hypothetical protein